MYFDWSATSIDKPPQVISAVVDALENTGNPSRGAYEASLKGLRTLHTARQVLAEFFGVPDPSRVVFAPNATHALNVVISSLEGTLVTTAAEHNSVLRPVFRHGDYRLVPADSQGNVAFSQLEKAMNQGASALIVSHSSNVTGNGWNLCELSALCRENGARLIVDAAQSAGLLPLDMEQMGIDALCFSGHKSLYGPQGTGGLCLAPDFQPQPLIVGGSGFHSFLRHQPTQLPEALEAGTQNAHGIAGLLAGVQYVAANQKEFFLKAQALAVEFLRGVESLPQAEIYGDVTLPWRTPVVSFNLKGWDSSYVADQLYQQYGIAVRAGFHCAPELHKAMGTEEIGAVRFSFSHKNTKEQVHTAIQAVKELAEAS